MEMIDRIQTSGASSTSLKPINGMEKKTLVADVPIHDNPKNVEDEKVVVVQEKEKIEEIVKGLNDFLSPSHTSLKFEFHEKLNEYYVTLIDEKTKEVVREIPSKKMLDFYAEMTQHIGLLVDKKI